METKGKSFRLVELVPTTDLGKSKEANEELAKMKSAAEQAYEQFKYLNSLGIVNCVYKKTSKRADERGREIEVDKVFSGGVLLNNYGSRYKHAISRDEAKEYVSIAQRLNQEPIRLAKIIKNYQEKICSLVEGAETELPKEIDSFISSTISNQSVSNLADDSSEVYTSYYGSGFSWSEVKCEKDQNFQKRYNNLTRVGLEQIKLLCDKLDFIIVPLEYLSEEAYKIDQKYEGSVLKKKVDEFKNMCNEIYIKEGHQEYVVCPIQFLDLLSWTHDKVERDVYFGKGLSIYATTIQMNIPVFKSLWGNIENLDRRVTDLEDLTKSIKGQVEVLNTNLKNLQTQVTNIGNQVAEMKIQQAKQGIAMNQLEVRTESLEAWRRCMQDPMIFSMPTKKLLRDRKDSDLGVVGFCWGPDFPEQFVYVLAIATNASKKANIEDWF